MTVHGVDPRQRVVVWRNAVLAGSETFIRDQFDALSWDRVLAGLSRVDSPNSRPADLVVYGQGRAQALRRKLFLATGRSGAVRRALVGIEPALLHVHFATDCWAVMKVARRLRVPVVVTVHGFDVTKWPSQSGLRGYLARWRLRYVLREAHQVIAVSGPIRDHAVRRGADPSRVTVLHTGVWVRPRAEAVTPNWDICMVGRLVEKKGAADLVEALALLRSHVQARAIVVGDGPLLESARRRAAELGVDIEFAGALPPEAVADVVRASKMLAVPSHTASDGDSEGLPTVILEASREGVPVVAYRHSGVPEAVLSGETGLLVTERDIAAFAEALARLLVDEKLRLSMGAEARRLVTEQFDITKQARLLEGVYAAVVERADGANASEPARQRASRK